MANKIDQSPEWIQGYHQLLKHDIRVAVQLRNEHTTQLIRKHRDEQRGTVAEIVSMGAALIVTFLLPSHLLMVVTALVAALYLISRIPGTIHLSNPIARILLLTGFVLVFGVWGLGALAATSMFLVNVSRLYRTQFEIKNITRINEIKSSPLSEGDLSILHELAEYHPSLGKILEEWTSQDTPITGYEYFLLKHAKLFLEFGSPDIVSIAA